MQAEADRDDAIKTILKNVPWHALKTLQPLALAFANHTHLSDAFLATRYATQQMNISPLFQALVSSTTGTAVLDSVIEALTDCEE